MSEPQNVSKAISVLEGEPVGPNGGNPLAAYLHPHWRNSPHNGAIDPVTGVPKLHRFEVKENSVSSPGLRNEQPWHRMAAFMLLVGRTNSEIAMASKRSPEEVSDLRNQIWFQELLAQLANDSGEAVMGILENEAVASVQKIADLRDHAESERVQLAAATTLLEHAKGKAVTPILQRGSSSKQDPKDEMESITQELAVLHQRLRLSAPTEN